MLQYHARNSDCRVRKSGRLYFVARLVTVACANNDCRVRNIGRLYLIRSIVSLYYARNSDYRVRKSDRLYLVAQLSYSRYCRRVPTVHNLTSDAIENALYKLPR